MIRFFLIAFILTTSFMICTVSASEAVSFDMTYDDNTHSITLPFDKLLKRNVTVVNTGDNYSEFEFILSYVEINCTYVGWPQPNYLYLDPGESQTIWAVLDAYFGEISSLSEGEYERTIQVVVYPRGDSSQNKSVNLTNVINVISQENIDKNSSVYGYVYDNSTKQPIGDIKVTLLGKGTTYNLESTTRLDGFYNISCPSSNFTLMVNVSRYETFRSIVKPLDSDGICLDIYMDKAKEVADYVLTKNHSTNLPLWRYDVSADEKYLAVSQGHFENVGAYFPDLSEGYILNNSYIHFFDIDNESLLWRYPVHGEVWGIDVSNDGNYITAPITNTEKVILLNHSGNLLWDTDSLGYTKIKSEEVRISNNNEYLAIGYGSGYLLLLNLSTGQDMWTMFVEGQVTQIVFNEEDTMIYVGSGDGYLYIFDINGTLILRNYIGAWPYRIQGLVLNDNESYIVTGSKLGDVCLTDLNGANSWCYDMKGCIYWVDISSDNRYIYASGGGEYGTAVFDIHGNMLWYDSFLSYIGTTTTDDNKEYILTSGRPPGVCNSKGTLLWSYDLPSANFYMTKDTSKIIAASVDGGLYFFDGKIEENTYECDLPGDYSPCGDVTLTEVVNFITLWVQGDASLSDVVALIGMWSSK